MTIDMAADGVQGNPATGFNLVVGLMKQSGRLDLSEMEKRLNERIDTRLVHR